MPLFPVDDLPPNKSVKGSMWANKEQARRLIALREAARRKLGPQVFAGQVRLTLKVHVGIPDWDTLDTDARRKALKERGDLDNFVTGVCDGLMAAHNNLLRAGTWHEAFDRRCEAIHPSKAVAYKDDSQVFEVRATKIVHSGNDWYEIELEELGRE